MAWASGTKLGGEEGILESQAGTELPGILTASSELPRATKEKQLVVSAEESKAQPQLP